MGCYMNIGIFSALLLYIFPICADLSMGTRYPCSSTLFLRSSSNSGLYCEVKGTLRLCIIQHWVPGSVCFCQERRIFCCCCYSRAIFIASGTTHIRRKQINNTGHLEPGSHISDSKHGFGLTFGMWVAK